MIESDVKSLRSSCWIRCVRFAILPSSILTMTASVMADAIWITSPNHPQTFTYGAMIGHELYFQRQTRELAARITFSNVPYAGDDEPRSDESFEFRFPGIQFDSAKRAFFMNSRQGERIPVARFRKGPSFGWIDLVPGAKIYLVKDSGRVTATLTATSYPRAGIRWVQTDNNFSLQNILIALFRDFRVQPEN